MFFTRLQLTVLTVAGTTALFIGLCISFTPRWFYASYGIDLGESVDLLSELRAPGFNLAVLGVVMLIGCFKPAVRPVAVIASLIVFVAFPLGRIVSIVIDGWPSQLIIAALALELLLAMACLLAFGRDAMRVIEPRQM